MIKCLVFGFHMCMGLIIGESALVHVLCRHVVVVVTFFHSRLYISCTYLAKLRLFDACHSLPGKENLDPYLKKFLY